MTKKLACKAGEHNWIYKGEGPFNIRKLCTKCGKIRILPKTLG